MKRVFTWTLILAAIFQAPSFAQEAHVVLKNGLEYEGEMQRLLAYSVLQTKREDGSIVFIDDGLRRVFFNMLMIASEVQVNPENPSIKVWQDFGGSFTDDWEFGQLTYADRFNKDGRRIIASNGREKFVQGIVEVNARYAKVVALGDPDWDMRIATTTLPSDVLIPLLRREIKDPNSINERLKIVRLLVLAKRYNDANAELASIQQEFPDLAVEYKDLRGEMESAVARQIVDDIRQRLEHGQAQLAQEMIPFLTHSNVSSSVLTDISDIEDSLRQQAADVAAAQKAVTEQLAKVRDEGKLDPRAMTRATEMIDEIQRDLSPTNLDRLATFTRFLTDEAQTATQKLSYAISGWLTGSSVATDNMALSIALADARTLVHEYLSSADAARRAEILQQLSQMESGEPSQLAKLIQYMLPPCAPNIDADSGKPLSFNVDLPNAADGNGTRSVEYQVQLPPEYDPYRSYPCLVVLHPQGRSAADELLFWCGWYNARFKAATGYAPRNGYIVVAPNWSVPGRPGYHYTAAEQLAVLKSTRDAMRRFSVDPDRIFLAGHFAGGDAAWDIGLSVPDVWAGVIPISAVLRDPGRLPVSMLRNGESYERPLLFCQRPARSGELGQERVRSRRAKLVIVESDA